MAVLMQQLAVMALPGGREVAVYLDCESPRWSGPAMWQLQEGRVRSWCVRLPLTDCVIRLVWERLAAAS